MGAAVTGQFVSLYQELQNFDDAAVARTLTIPRLAFAGAADTITYGPGWGDVVVDIAGPLGRHRPRLQEWGWDVHLLAGLDHLAAIHASQVLPLLQDWVVHLAH